MSRLTLRSASCSSRGLTLFEVVLSLAIISILMLAVGSMMVLMTRALPERSGPASRLTDTAQALEQLNDDLRLASSVTELTSTSVTMRVPDQGRDADLTGELVRYAQSGDELTRQINGGPAEALASEVASVVFSRRARIVPARTMPEATGGASSSEQLVVAHEDAPSGTMLTFEVKDHDAAATYFVPDLPEDAVSWTPTRVELVMSTRASNSTTYHVEIRGADGSRLPTSEVHASVDANPKDLPRSMGAWCDHVLTGAPELVPDTGYCLVIRSSAANGSIVNLRYESTGAPMPPDAHWMTSSAATPNWSAPEATQDLVFRLYGTYRARTP